ncbi:MAG: hypothetical protein AB7T06_13175 [Kofleriaceae bacterium]
MTAAPAVVEAIVLEDIVTPSRRRPLRRRRRSDGALRAAVTAAHAVLEAIVLEDIVTPSRRRQLPEVGGLRPREGENGRRELFLRFANQTPFSFTSFNDLRKTIRRRRRSDGALRAAVRIVLEDIATPSRRRPLPEMGGLRPREGENGRRELFFASRIKLPFRSPPSTIFARRSDDEDDEDEDDDDEDDDDDPTTRMTTIRRRGRRR